MKQTQALEIGIPVRDLDRMVTFYCEVFGCSELRRAEIPAELSRAIGVAPDGYVNVWLELPGGEVIKLVQPPVPPEDNSAPDFFAARTGIAYFTFFCADIVEAVEKAEAFGATLASERALLDQEGVKLGFLRDPEGNVFEFVQR